MLRHTSVPELVTPGQFTSDAQHVTHLPTGAVFAVQGRSLVSEFWGIAGLVPGAKFDPAEIKKVAYQLMRIERI
jgi:hypothetical protein